MVRLKVPSCYRSGGYLKPCELGVDLPAWFVDGVQAIDKDLYPIFHPFQVIWDDLINNHSGSLDDPRFTIGTPPGFSYELWGYPMKQRRSDAPILDGTWHLWRACHSVGAWAHVIRLESRNDEYLAAVLELLYFNAKFSDKYGHHALNRHREEEQENLTAKEQQDRDDLFTQISKANKRLLTSAAAELASGRYRPTNPQKETIIGYAGQTNRSRIVRPLEDREGGLIVPDEYVEN